jgi:hypothetical protein
MRSSFSTGNLLLGNPSKWPEMSFITHASHAGFAAAKGIFQNEMSHMLKVCAFHICKFY